MEEALTRIWPIDKDVKVRDFIPLQNKPMDPWLYAVQQAMKLAGALQLQHEQSRGRPYCHIDARFCCSCSDTVMQHSCGASLNHYGFASDASVMHY
jgi:hypothetical protein